MMKVSPFAKPVSSHRVPTSTGTPQGPTLRRANAIMTPQGAKVHHSTPPVCAQAQGQPLLRRPGAGPKPARQCTVLPKVNSSNGFILLKMMDINFRRIGNLMWCYASLIGIARTNDFEPRVEAPAYRELKELFPAIELNYEVGNKEAYPRVDAFSNFMKYQPELMHLPPNTALEGWLQSHRYFEHHKDYVRSMFCFNETIEKQALDFIAFAKRESGQCPNSMAVAIHVRRGDIQTRWQAMKVPTDYYRRAIDRIREKFPTRNMTYIVMAGGNEARAMDESDYNFADEHIPVRHMPTPLHHASYLDLAILAYSDAVVMSGGSFGFWGGYLNHDVCIAPNCALATFYVEHSNNDDYYPPWCERLVC